MDTTEKLFDFRSAQSRQTWLGLNSNNYNNMLFHNLDIAVIISIRIK